MASRKIQATLSERSSARVDQIQETFKKLRSELPDSAAVNNLIELLCDIEAENKKLRGEILDLKCELGTHQDNHQQIMKEGGE